VIVAIVVGGAILIGSLLLFGPIGLLFALIAVPLGSWMFSGGWSISEKDRQHAREVDESFSILFGKKK
jgi:hypothetical protein